MRNHGDVYNQPDNWWNYPEDEHGDFEYTLRQWLHMYRLSKGGDWADVTEWTRRQIMHNEWDPDETRTYADWSRWYILNRTIIA